MPEPEVNPDEYDTGAHRIHQHSLDEVLRAQSAEFLGELHHDEGTDASAFQDFALLGGAGEARRHLLRIEQGERMSVEGQHRRHKPRRLRSLAQLRDHTAVTGMHTVKLADCHGRRTEVARQFGKGAEKLHG